MDHWLRGGFRGWITGYVVVPWVGSLVTWWFFSSFSLLTFRGLGAKYATKLLYAGKFSRSTQILNFKFLLVIMFSYTLWIFRAVFGFLALIFKLFKTPRVLIPYLSELAPGRLFFFTTYLNWLSKRMALIRRLKTLVHVHMERIFLKMPNKRPINMWLLRICAPLGTQRGRLFEGGA